MLKSLALVFSIIGLMFVVTVKCKQGMYYSDHIFNSSFPSAPLAIKRIMILFKISQPDLNALKWNNVENVKQYDHDCFDCQIRNGMCVPKVIF